MLVMTLFWVLIIVGGFLLIRYVVDLQNRATRPPPGESPMDILNKRYARGEISKEEYDKIRQDLAA